MKKSISRLLKLIGMIILSGCAASYKPIYPQTLNYQSHDLQDGMRLSYKYDVLRERGNKKYAKKEINKGVKLIAVKLTNHTDSVINVGRDVTFYSGYKQIFPMDPMATKESIKQIVPGYLPYLLLTLVNLQIYQGSSVQTYRIGLGLGPGITFGNMIVAGSANKAMLDELYEYNILGLDIPKGETVYGIIGVRDLGYDPITIKLNK